MINKLFIIGLLIITGFVVYLYLSQQQQYYKYNEQTNKMELKFIQEKKLLDDARSQTQICPTPNLETPKKCYHYSNYECLWNETTKSCNKII